mgnify:CR=1 FL=1
MTFRIDHHFVLDIIQGEAVGGPGATKVHSSNSFIVRVKFEFAFGRMDVSIAKDQIHDQLAYRTDRYYSYADINSRVLRPVCIWIIEVVSAC